MAVPVRRLAWSLLLLAILLLLGGVLWGVLGVTRVARSVAPTDRATLLSNPTVRDWMHALSEEEREVASLRRQQAAQPGVPLPAGEALDQEEEQLRRTWRGLAAEWLADGGRGEDCPGAAGYQALMGPAAVGK